VAAAAIERLATDHDIAGAARRANARVFTALQGRERRGCQLDTVGVAPVSWTGSFLTRASTVVLGSFQNANGAAAINTEGSSRQSLSVRPWVEALNAMKRKIADISGRDRQIVMQRCSGQQPVDYR
jgi:hypothetical protein